MSVTGSLDQVIALAREVAELRERQAQIDVERAAIDGQIADRVNRLAVAAVAAVTPANAGPAAASPGPMPLSAAILYVIHQRPEKVFTATEIADLLKMTDRRDYSAIRTHLSRMAKDGRLAKPAFGKYRAP
jgi:hypothetical protein